MRCSPSVSALTCPAADSKASTTGSRSCGRKKGTQLRRPVKKTRPLFDSQVLLILALCRRKGCTGLCDARHRSLYFGSLPRTTSSSCCSDAAHHGRGLLQGCFGRPLRVCHGQQRN